MDHKGKKHLDRIHETLLVVVVPILSLFDGSTFLDASNHNLPGVHLLQFAAARCPSDQPWTGKSFGNGLKTGAISLRIPTQRVPIFSSFDIHNLPRP